MRVTSNRTYIIIAVLLALFLGALDALVMSAAMPTIVAELGGIKLYSWVYSAYFLARAVSLPLVGKLADLYCKRRLFLIAVSLFLVASAGAGAAPSMAVLVGFRVIQGVGAGGIFALVYIILSDIAEPARRGKTLSFASSVWGISSIVGPTLGGFIVTYFSWRWIFFINIPLALISLCGIAFFLQPKGTGEKRAELDLGGILSFASFILCFLIIFIIGGREVPWVSMPIILLVVATVVFGLLFFYFEQRAAEPVLDFRFFARRNFAWGNLATFFASFTIFSLFAYAPLYIQGGIGKSPMEVGLAMLSLSLGWSCGSLVLGRFIDGGGGKRAALWGGVLLCLGTVAMQGFDAKTSMVSCFWTFFVIGGGMGFVTLSTLLLVQNSVSGEDLGVATAFHQFARTLGGTVGVGICGGMVTYRLIDNLAQTKLLASPALDMLQEGVENIFKPEFQAILDPQSTIILHQAVNEAMVLVYNTTLITSLCCLACGLLLVDDR